MTCVEAPYCLTDTIAAHAKHNLRCVNGIYSIVKSITESRIGEQFSNGAQEYDKAYSQREYFRQHFEAALATCSISRDRSVSTIVWDMGSGSGLNSVFPITDLLPNARVVATDLSIELLERLRRNSLAAGRTDVICPLQLDLAEEVFSPRSFDLVCGVAILHHLSDPTLALHRARQALRPGGSAIFMEPFDGHYLMRLAYQRVLGEADRRPLDPVIRDAMQRIVLDTKARTAPDTTSLAWSGLDDKWYFSREMMLELSENAGFSRCDFIPHSDRPHLYRNLAGIQMRLATGRSDLILPSWTIDILNEFDDAMPACSKRALMTEATILLHC